MMIATWINSMLWALEIVQVIRIWKCVCLSVRRMTRAKSPRRRNYPKDPLMIRGIMLACLTFDTACTCAACATVYLVSFPYSSNHGLLTALQVLHHQLGQPAGTRPSILDFPFVHHHYDDDRNHCAVVPRVSLLVTVSVLQRYPIDHAHAKLEHETGRLSLCSASLFSPQQRVAHTQCLRLSYSLRSPNGSRTLSLRRKCCLGPDRIKSHHVYPGCG
jgi:hypothetical protein